MEYLLFCLERDNGEVVDFNDEDEDDWNEDDYDVEVIYTDE